MPSNDAPPIVSREFRAAWVATVWNIDWPSKPGLSASRQQAELIAILNRAAELNLNAIILQVRPGSDALYSSQIEPWSAFLTGAMGRPPSPFYDPLAFAVKEAHQRGIELHAWFNPFRALVTADARPSSTHIARTRPDLTRKYGSLTWLDPGDPAVREHVIRVIRDVVRRYDIDGVHLDDYFYPYVVRTKAGATIDFPDSSTWGRYLDSGGKLSRGDWRRGNVNTFVQRLNETIKSEKPWVKFGISPFGIWRPRVPPSIEAGLDAYGELYADSRTWLQRGWVDYLSPQLYWSIEPAKQSYPVLLRWWAGENTARRHLWPGIATERIGSKRPASEIIRQIQITRELGRSEGHIHWSMKSLMNNQGRIATTLESGLYAQPALVPSSPWLGRGSPAQPRLAMEGLKMSWSQPGGGRVARWVVQLKFGGEWVTKILGDGETSYTVQSRVPDAVAVTAIDRVGNAGLPAVLERR